MKTDISRNTFRSDKNYSGVRRQQGRVDLDADWNEQVDIFNHRTGILTVDSLGPVGAPANDAGFMIAPTGDSLDLTVSPGRFYIDGHLVQNEKEFNISTQTDLPGVALPAADGNYLAYLKVFERGVTALEAPEIRETALGGPDTTTRTKIVRQIHLAPVAGTDLDSRTVPPEWNTIISRNPGRMSARTEADGAQTDPCAVGVRGGYTGLDNLLYRVEIHESGLAGSATYKWSRDNGALVTEWLELDGNTLTVRSTGNDNVLNFAPGQWIEISDDGLELEGIAGTLAQILRVEGRRITINPDNIRHFAGSAGTLDIAEFSRGVRKVRRWDMVGAAVPSTVPDGSGGEVWVSIENGIEVKFDDLASGREFQTGDYWMFPARANLNNIEWACDNDGNIEHDPHGTYFHYARLAFVNATGGTWTTVADTREIFPGLTDEQLAYVGGDGQLSVPGQILDRPLEVRVTRGATPVADAQVRFTVTSGTGTIEDAPGGTSGTTLDIKADADGIARAYWTLADAVAGQSVRAVLLDENDAETALYVVFGAGSGVASGIQYTPISTDSSVAGTTNVQEALDALADNKVNRSGDTMTGNLTVNADLEVTGNMTIRGDVIARDATQQAGDILLGDDDVDRVIIHGTVQSQHTSGALEIEAPVHTRTTDPTKSPLRVDGPSTGGSPRLYRLPLDVDHTNASATTLNDYQLLLTVDTATPISAGRMKSDGGDILFENEDGSGLFYWVESGMNTATTRIWVRVPAITAAANRTIYMLYGNSNAVSQSSSADTFVREISGQQLAYNFDEGSGTTAIDYSPNGFDGTITGATYTTGISGQALDFDGTTNRASTPVTLPAVGTGDVSVSLWYQPRQITGDHRVLIVDGTLNNFQVDISLTGEIAFWTGASNTRSPAFPFTLNTWYHIATVRESGQTTIYVNGVVIHSAANTGNVQASTFFDIGYRTLDGAHPVDGLIDEPRVLHRAMTMDEVADEYNNAGYLSLANSGVEMIRRVTNIEPVITPSAEEANPVSESPILFAQETSGNIGIGTDDPTEKLTVEGIIETKTGGIKFPDGTIQTTAGGPGGAGGDSLALGTIMAWHKSLDGTPEIPEGWVQCDGQVLNDVDSPYHNLVIPNLNGERRFLRGGAISGDFEEDQMQGHRHSYQQVSTNLSAPGAILVGGGTLPHIGNNTSGPISDGGNGNPRVGSETRPVNMSVVWIMKIKKVDGQSGLWEVGTGGIRYDDGKVSVGTTVADEQLTVSGAISLEEKILEPDTTDDFGKLYVRENDLSHLHITADDQHVSMPSLDRPGVADFSIAAWFKIEVNDRATSVPMYILDLREENMEGPTALALVTPQGNGDYTLKTSYSWPTGGSSEATVTLGNAMDIWNHVVLVREGASIRTYVNGRLVNSAPDTGVAPKSDLMPWDHPWRIGQRSNVTGPGVKNFPGSLDDIGLWERALSDDEAATLHNSGRGSDVPTAFASSLVAFYPMSQSATPGQLDDVSGNNFHGTIQNGAVVIPEKVGSLYFKDGFGNVTSLAGGGDSYRTGGSGNQVPVGTIMAWHKDEPNTPAIPDGWVECNGLPLDDPKSPYHGQTIPDLNGEERFLRGGSTSGTMQKATKVVGIAEIGSANEIYVGRIQPGTSIVTEDADEFVEAGGNGGRASVATSIDPSSANERHDSYRVRSKNMSVIWIMKVRETDRDRGLWREQGEDIYFDDGKVAVGAKTANAKVHIATTDVEETPLRVDGQLTLEGIQGRRYRLPITLDNTANTEALHDHNIELTVDTAALVSAGKMRADGADIVMVDGDGKTLLPFFISSGMNTAATKIWIRTANLPEETARMVFMQYGKSEIETSLSSAAATFLREVPGIAMSFTFDEGTGLAVTDYSGNSNDGNVIEAAWAADKDGNANRALHFDGVNDHVQITNSPSLNIASDITLSAWIFNEGPGTGSQSANVGNIIAKHNTALARSYLLSFEHTSQGIRFTLTDTNDANYFHDSSVLNTNQWYHVVATYNKGSGEARIFIDGALDTTTNFGSFDLFQTNRDVFVGCYQDNPDGSGRRTFFKGTIDDPRIYNRALTAIEVADLYNQGGDPTIKAGSDVVVRRPNLDPVIAMAAEEPNPVSGSPILFAQNLTGNVGLGTDEPQAKLHIAGEAGVDGIMFPDGSVQTSASNGGGGDATPLGTIIAWHKNLSGSPAIPEGWVECNGQVLSDVESPFNGQVIPNLNGDGRFLRGAGTSGTLQSDAFQGHRHDVISPVNDPVTGDAGGVDRDGSPTSNTQPVIIGDPITDGVNGTPRIADETRPVNMSVVWIMKIKQVDGQDGLWTETPAGAYFNDGKVSVGTTVADEQLTVAGAISLEEKILEPDTTDDFGKIYVRENDLSHLTLDGVDQYISMPNMNRPALADNTFSIWFRITEKLFQVGDFIWFLDTREEVIEGPGIEIILQAQPNNTYNLYYSINWPTGGGGGQAYVALGSISSEWHHMAISREGAVVRLYVDGRLASSEPSINAPAKNDPFNWTVPWRVGRRAEDSNPNYFPFPGSLDDLGVWERALSPDEIATLHNSGRGSDVPVAFASSLLAFYPMSQSATPGQIDDVSGNDLHGTIQNGATITPEKVGSLYFKDGFGNVTALAGGGDSYRTGGSGNQVPVGTIMAWHKSLNNTPAIPDGWAECNGQTLIDPASPYNGEIIPNLNGDPLGADSPDLSDKQSMFLRGGLTSGAGEEDQFQGHRHGFKYFTAPGNNAADNYLADLGGPTSVNSTTNTVNLQLSVQAPLEEGSNGTPRTGPETRPVNMSVVWIMKVRETDADRGLWRENGEDIYFDDGKVGVGAKSANAKLHVSVEDNIETPLRIDGQTTIQGVQGRLYRAPITLDNTDTTNLVDHQVLITLDTQALVSAGKMRFDGGDILFVDTDGKTILPHLIESGMNTATTNIWVRVPAILAGESRGIFMQYGKADATSPGSTPVTFIRALDDLALAWDFEEGTGSTTSDASGNGNTGITTGSWITGYRGQALNFTTNQGVSTAPRTWGFSHTTTISAWIKTSDAHPSTVGTVASFGDPSLNNELLIRVNSDGTVGFFASSTAANVIQRNTISNVETGNWLHIVTVMDGGIDAAQMRVYVNGIREDGSISTSGTPAPISDAVARIFSIGHRPTQSEYFHGDIDQVRLFSRALSDQEIADMYANESLVATDHPSREFIYKATPVAPTINVAAEEPNPVSGSPILFAQNLTGNVGIGTDDPLAKLHVAGTAGVDGIMFPDGTFQSTSAQGGGGDSTPIGTIIAWHKSMTGTPAMPTGWVECNGQTLDDIDSPYHNLDIPDLNNPKESWNLKGSFLRGDTTSGVFEDDSFQGHHHTTNASFMVTGGGAYNGGFNNDIVGTVGDPIAGNSGPVRVDTETRPVNMSVVWIIKVRQTDSSAWLSVVGGLAYSGGDVAIGDLTPNSKLTIDGALSMREHAPTTGATLGFGKLFTRATDLSYLELDGNQDYVTMPALGATNVGDFTVSIWFRLRVPNPTSPVPVSYMMDVRGDTAVVDFGPHLILEHKGNGVMALVHAAGVPSSTPQFGDEIGNVIGEWHHTVMAREGAVFKQYLDGRLISDTPLTGTPSATPFDLNTIWRVGTSASFSTGDPRFWHGSLDDLALWSRKLSDGEIAAIYNAGRGTDLTTTYSGSMLGFWPMDDGPSATTIRDASGNGLDGTLQNGAAIVDDQAGALMFQDGFGNTTALTGNGGSSGSIGTGREVPLGTIMAWHKSLTGSPAMPIGWVECNGQVLSDSESPYDTQTIPNLNGDPVGADSPDVADKKSMFLRGGLTSGLGEDDAFQGHHHNLSNNNEVLRGGGGNAVQSGTGSDSYTLSVQDPTSDGTHGAPRIADETRPTNMTVVWIMKVKHVGNGAWESVSSGLAFMGNRVGIGTTFPESKLHVDGFITKQEVAFTVQDDSLFIFSAADTVVPYTTAVTNVGGGFQGDNETFVAPEAGVYVFSSNHIGDPGASGNDQHISVAIYHTDVDTSAETVLGTAYTGQSNGNTRSPASITVTATLKQGDSINTRVSSPLNNTQHLISRNFTGWRL